MNKYFVTAIGTNSGKTIVSAILMQAFQADYWKPVQSGLVDCDSETVNNLLLNDYSVIHPEQYRLLKPASPHESAALEGVEIKLENFVLPFTDGNDLIIEGAGGVLVPLNDKDCIIDLIEHLDAEVVLVADYYLGSINHTLLTVECLKQRGIAIKGLVFNGEENSFTKSIILSKTGLRCLLDIKKEEKWDAFLIQQYAVKLFDHWNVV